MYSNENIIGMPGAHPKERSAELVWPPEGLQTIPDWVYTDQSIYDREMERIFHGATWNFVALEAEIENPGDFKRSYVGPTPVVVTRALDGSINVIENRCQHRGAEFCRHSRGNAKELVCPYHQWTYDLKGNLQGVPFKRGVNRAGGMPPDFRNEDHGLKKLKVAVLHGVVFATFAEEIEPIEEYLGTEMLIDFDAVFKGRKLVVLGHYRNELPGNWKLYFENLRDPYHATLLHGFLVSYGLVVAGSKTSMMVDPSGRHGSMGSARPANVTDVVDQSVAAEMRAFKDDATLEDARFLNYVPEFDSPWSVTMQTLWPNLVVQRELNTLGVRHIVPNGPHSMIMVWTMFGYEGDTEEMRQHRLRQGNLMGPAGFLGVEDNEAIRFVQEGLKRSPTDKAVVRLGGDTVGSDTTTLITESAIRAMYQQYRETMGL
jgi:anthranilate 1,2-dioxygenase large subunit